MHATAEFAPHPWLHILRQCLIDAILSSDITTPKKMISREAKDFIFRGLAKDPLSRPTVANMLEHLFVIGTKIEEAKGKMLQASHLRKLQGGAKSSRE